MKTPKSFILTNIPFLSPVLLCRVMFSFGNLIWDLIIFSFFCVFWLIKYIARPRVDNQKDVDFRVVGYEEDDQVESEYSIFNETETSQLSFGFRFQTGIDLSVLDKTESSVFRENSLSISTSNYQVITAKDIGGFIEEPKAMSFVVQESFMEPYKIIDTQDLITQNHQRHVLDLDFDDNQETEDSVQDEDAKTLNWLEESFIDEARSNSESRSCSGEFSVNTQKIFPSDCSEFESDLSIFIEKNEEFIDKVLRFEDNDESILIRDILEESDDDYIEFEPNFQHSSDQEFIKLGKNTDSEEQSMDNQEKKWDLEYDDQEEEENDILLEHGELIEKMKIEQKNVRTGGLPTILEDCETPKMAADLRPLKIDEKFEHTDQIAEIQNFYKSYAEKMRKLDILNYQTMHAISFLQLKDPNQSGLYKRSSGLAFKSLLSPSLRPYKLRKIHADPTLKSIGELQKDLEVVYVGQICLSWEILHWQYRKVKHLIECDSQGCHSYNHVAGEFQQFQVLVTRFIEDEQFKEPRILNYLNNRSVVRSFLQVPLVKGDCLKDKKGRKKEDEEEEEYEISILIMADIIEESMRIFCGLIRADRDAANVSLNGTIREDSANAQLLSNIKTALQKKEKRLKDIMRSGNCLVKKFKKQQVEGRILDHKMLVCQVELKLVSRVVNMSKISNDQLLWCQTKLNNINFVNSKIFVESSFLLFPC